MTSTTKSLLLLKVNIKYLFFIVPKQMEFSIFKLETAVFFQLAVAKCILQNVACSKRVLQ